MKNRIIFLSLSVLLLAFSSFTLLQLPASGETSLEEAITGFPVIRNGAVPTTVYAHKRISDVMPILIGGSKLYFSSEYERDCFLNQDVDPSDPRAQKWSYYFNIAGPEEVSYPLYNCSDI